MPLDRVSPWVRLSTVVLCLTALDSGSSDVVARTGSSEVPIPEVTAVPGDPPGSADRNYPFFATDIVLTNYGYVEQEFFYEGTANTYTAPAFGSNAEIATGGTPYRSRLLVRRPAQQSRFNGVVIVEWFNVTNGYDTDVLWLYQKEFFIREGYAWVGVSAQNVGLSHAQRHQGLESEAIRHADVNGGGKVTGRRPRLRHLLAGGRSHPQRARGPGGTAVHVRDRRRPVTVGGTARDVPQRHSSSAPIYDAALLTVSSHAVSRRTSPSRSSRCSAKRRRPAQQKSAGLGPSPRRGRSPAPPIRSSTRCCRAPRS